MKHLRKFEELDYSTYISAADKMASYGQTSKAEEVKKHAVNMARRVIDNLEFGILVGGVRTFPNAKFENARIFKSGNAWSLQAIFQSGDNTHSISCKVVESGEVTWTDGNKFMDRGSVLRFQQLIRQLAKFQPGFVSFVNENNITPEDLKVVLRTFYN